MRRNIGRSTSSPADCFISGSGTTYEFLILAAIFSLRLDSINRGGSQENEASYLGR